MSLTVIVIMPIACSCWQKSREENQELRTELDVMKMDSFDLRKKGNSLFAEVEDKRVEAERLLISMKVQYESLQKQHEFTRQQMLKLKVGDLMTQSACALSLLTIWV